MAKKKVQSKLGITDIAAAWKAGWTPSEVNALLDRVDEMNDLNEADEDDEDEDLEDEEDLDDEATDEDEDSDDEDLDESNEDEDSDDEDSTSTKKARTKTQTKNSANSLEIENKRLKKQLEKLQAKNRFKDISKGGKPEKTIEKSLIDTVQSLFD